MIIQQEASEFKPITIILETREEANALWDIIEASFKYFPTNSPERDLAIKISNWFSFRTESYHDLPPEQP